MFNLSLSVNIHLASRVRENIANLQKSFRSRSRRSSTVSSMDKCLGDCGFSFRLPKAPSHGDEIAIKGVLRNDTKRFSINLCLDRPEGCDPDSEPEYIAYHLGLDFSDGSGVCRVTQSSRNVDWIEPLICIDEAFNARTVNVVLRLDEESIKVFHEDTQHAPDYEYNYQLPIGQIRTIELRDGDVQVEEIRLKFSH